MSVHGLHHVTAIAGDPRENLAFYTGVLGMRLVKRTVNQDAVDTYHFFYADAAGTPGTDLTFFPWPKMAAGKRGTGFADEIGLAVPAGSLDDWSARLESAGVGVSRVESPFSESTLRFRDPHGLRLALVEIDDERSFEPWREGPVAADLQIRGLHSVCLWQADPDATADFLIASMGLHSLGREGARHRLAADGAGSGMLVDLLAPPEPSRGRWGPGTVHHVAWRLRDEEEEISLRESLVQAGLQPTPVIDRFWFKSVYFREPGGVLFELATDGPGFTADEDLEHLGQKLILPPWLEDRRAEIEAGLPPVGETDGAP